ncbi:MAG: hypothetical protein KDA98_11755 [Acidimicrobiales bacterium]|nr:hypothetical protein [Acidimicrobiales bacterium]
MRAAALTVGLALGGLAAPAGAQPLVGGSTTGGGSAERIWVIGHGDCIWGVVPVLGHQVVVLMECERGDEEGGQA